MTVVEYFGQVEEHFAAEDHRALDEQAEADRGVQASSSCDEIFRFFQTTRKNAIFNGN